MTNCFFFFWFINIDKNEINNYINQIVNDMQCISDHSNGNTAKIKQETDNETGQKLSETISLHTHSKPQNLQSRTEMQQVIKNQNNGNLDDDGQLHSFGQMTTQSPFGSPNSRTQTYGNGDFGRDMCPELQQRVHVIKDGRYYEEPRSVHPSESPPSAMMHSLEESSPSVPPLMPVQQTESSKRMVVNRQVIVNAQIPTQTVEPRETASVVFRPPVVSSSCQSMRPPPPPPPKLKGTASEEPSSSIPDLGKLSSLFS